METHKKYSKNKEISNKGTFTHFISLPLIETALKGKLYELQKKILAVFSEDEQKLIDLNNPNLFHITLSMLSISKEEDKLEAQEILKRNHEAIKKVLDNSKLKIKLGKILTFSKQEKPQKPSKSIQIYKKPHSKKQNQQNLIYLEIQEDESFRKIMQFSHLLIKEFLEKELMDTSDLKPMKVFYDHNSGFFRAEKFHITLFRVDESVNLDKIKKEFDSFEFGEAECNSVDISTRFLYDEEKFYMPLFRISF